MSELSTVSHLTTKTGKELHVCRGYNEDIIGQLAVKSKEPEIAARCPKDAKTRFTDHATFDKWVHKGNGGRTLYPLLNPETNELDGIIWLGVEAFGYENYPQADKRQLMLGRLMTDTYAIRVYDSLASPNKNGERQGSGVAKPFTRDAIKDYARLRTTGDQGDKPRFTGIHLETDIDNIKARSTYERLSVDGREGFWPIAENPDKNRVAMALPLSHMAEVLDIELAN